MTDGGRLSNDAKYEAEKASPGQDPVDTVHHLYCSE